MLTRGPDGAIPLPTVMGRAGGQLTSLAADPIDQSREFKLVIRSR